jgi:predicted amidophosphoribosyltransferase
VRGTFVWIVDDVVTSGATVAECARVLRRMGAARVGVLALARASS